jgi:hypothetical protein
MRREHSPWVDRGFLLLLAVPALVAILLDLKMHYDGTVTIALVDIRSLLKNTFWLAVGLTLLIQPNIVVSALSNRLLERVQAKRKQSWWLRLIGLVLIVLTIVSSRFLIAELQASCC